VLTDVSRPARDAEQHAHRRIHRWPDENSALIFAADARVGAMNRTEGAIPMTHRQRILWSIVWLPVAVVIATLYAIAVALTWLRSRLAPLALRRVGHWLSASLRERSAGLHANGAGVARRPVVVPEIRPSLDRPDAGHEGIG